MNNFVWANDNPAQCRSRPTAGSPLDATIARSSRSSRASSHVAQPERPSAAHPIVMPTPTLAQRDKKINLNYPLPVSNDPNEPIRQKWISDTYQLFKAILPAQGGRHPRRAGAAQPVRHQHRRLPRPGRHDDPLRNPDVRWFSARSRGNDADLPPRPTWPPLNRPATRRRPRAIPLDQYGMEYNPVAINEVLAYSFQIGSETGATPTNRFFIELVNTLTQTAIRAAARQRLGGRLTRPLPISPRATYAGQLGPRLHRRRSRQPSRSVHRPAPALQYANYYGLIPLNQAIHDLRSVAHPGAADVQLLPGRRRRP